VPVVVSAADKPPGEAFIRIAKTVIEGLGGQQPKSGNG
jgi:hypothetical protein